MQDRNAQKLIDMLVYKFGKSAEGVFNLLHPDLLQAWSTDGTQREYFEAAKHAAQKGWIKKNLNSWQLTKLGAEAAGK